MKQKGKHDGKMSSYLLMVCRFQSLYRSSCRQTVKDESQRSISLADHADIQQYVTNCLRRSEINPRTAVCLAQLQEHYALAYAVIYLSGIRR